jgi:hypothetical protein
MVYTPPVSRKRLIRSLLTTVPCYSNDTLLWLWLWLWLWKAGYGPPAVQRPP